MFLLLLGKPCSSLRFLWKFTLALMQYLDVCVAVAPEDWVELDVLVDDVVEVLGDHP